MANGEIGLYANTVGGGGGGGTLQATLNAGNSATNAGGGTNSIVLEDQTGNPNLTVFPGSITITDFAALFQILYNSLEIKDTSNNDMLLEPTFIQFSDPDGVADNSILGPLSLTIQDNTVYKAVLTKNSLTLTNNAGNKIALAIGSAGPTITYTVGTDVTIINWAAPSNVATLTVKGGVTGNVAVDPQVNAQTGTTYTFHLGDAFNYVTANNSALQVYTVPPHSSVAFPVGCTIQVMGIGTGKVTIVAGAGVTINSAGGNLSINGQYVGVSLVQIVQDTWMLMGNLTA